MKRCPTCNRTYSDETLSFCLADGALLSASEDPQATLVLTDSPDVQETLRLPASQAPQATQPASTSQVTAIELRNITKRFGEVLANDHVNIKVK